MAVRSIQETVVLVTQLLAKAETEVVEYKSAKNSYDFDEIGRYFSALSNEANLRHTDSAWLLFGVRNDRTICGTSYRMDSKTSSTGLQKLKHEITKFTNDGMTFEEIYELRIDGKRVIAFQIPPAMFATPTTWKGIPWSRENESLVEMPHFKIETIYSQSRPDWSRQTSFEATLNDLDEDAIAFAQAKFASKYKESQPSVETLSPEDVLSKIGLLVRGRVTNAALVLLGKPESFVFFDGIEPRITWSLYSSKDEVIAYDHFEPPFILNVDRVLQKIRNEKFRYFPSSDTLFPVEMERYSPEVIRELLHNAIAHQDYRLSGKINILEYEDKLVFKNEGSFIPGTIDAALENGYKPPYYRNPLLSAAMSKTGMIDQNSIGIRNIFNIQRSRYMPMPTYDLSQPYRVSVTLFGRELNHDYSRLLADNHNLDFGSVILLDMLQKGQHVTKSQAKLLHGQGLVEGRYPRIHISSGVASVVGEHEAYLRNKGLDNSICKQLIVQLLNMQPSTRSEILSAVEHALPADLTNEQKLKRLSYLLQSLRKGGVIEKEGSTANSVWHIRKE